MVSQENDKVSKIMLIYLRHRYNIVMGVICVLNVLFLTVLTVKLDDELSQIKVNNDAYMKGSSCVQLIPDDKVTKQSIIDCMNKNTDNKKKDFDFQELGNVRLKPVTTVTDIAFRKEETMEDVQISEGSVNEEQEDRKEGVVPRIIKRIREDGVEEFQSEGDTLWQHYTKVNE
jgi:hypothetical protein